MAPLNFNDATLQGEGFEAWIIEDSWEGPLYLEARLLKTWQGVCGYNKLLEDRDGGYYWWVVLFAPENGRALQRVVTFLDWESLATELGLSDSLEESVGSTADSWH